MGLPNRLPIKMDLVGLPRPLPRRRVAPTARQGLRLSRPRLHLNNGEIDATREGTRQRVTCTYSLTLT